MATLIAVEGIDGSGKATQTRLLGERLSATGRSVATIAFPAYEHTFFGREISRYLNGEFGSIEDIHPKLISLLYAGDRFECRAEILSKSAQCEVLLFDRFTGSNIAHQSAKLPPQERAAFREWVEDLEFRVYQLPRPDHVIFLDLPPQRTRELVLMKEVRGYTSKALDLHEENDTYLADVYEAYCELSKGEGWLSIPCLDGPRLRTPSQIHEAIWASLHQLGAFQPAAASLPVSVQRTSAE